MIYTVRPGDSLWSIASALCRNPYLWPQIADDNHIRGTTILVGQSLVINDVLCGRRAAGGTSGMAASGGPSVMGGARFAVQSSPSDAGRPALIPTLTHVFVLADEINVFNKKVVRRVLVSSKMAAEVARQVGRPLKIFPSPERFGFQATGPDAMLSIGRHATGTKPSPFISSSSLLFGAQRFTGEPFWIDVVKAQNAGASLHGTDEIVADLSRIGSKMKTQADKQKIESLKKLVVGDGEVLIKGPVPASAVKGATAMGVTRVLQGVQVVGFTLSAVDLGNAAGKSIDEKSLRPIGAETLRQAGGWAGAWAGVKVGAAAGAMVGVETGPVAVVTMGVGSIVGAPLDTSGPTGYLTTSTRIELFRSHRCPTENG